jgi:hypothetical protein
MSLLWGRRLQELRVKSTLCKFYSITLLNLLFTGKIIKLNFEVNETLKTYNQVLQSPVNLKPKERRNEENLLDLNISILPGMYF